MREEYDFSQAQKGRFYSPTEPFQLPVYLDQETQEYLISVAESRDQDLGTVVNALLKEEIKIHKDILSKKAN
tara:strand:+ start:346 stop:561 length:216 start_codon:yes stop_codon:yes gene_type:complete